MNNYLLIIKKMVVDAERASQFDQQVRQKEDFRTLIIKANTMFKAVEIYEFEMKEKIEGEIMQITLIS
jgi:hypothetical protein